jgi:hypothetical protein
MASGAHPNASLLLAPRMLLPLLALAALTVMPALWRQWRTRTHAQARDSA